MASSASSSSDSSRPSTPAPSISLKRKRKANDKPVEPERDDGSSDSGSSESEEDGEPEEDVPALSHAEKRRQKKKEEREAKKAASAPSDESAAVKKRKTNSGAVVSSSSANSKKEKRQNSVWIGNLSFKTTPENLTSFFDGVGEITRIHMPTKAGDAKGENMGFAYVDFASPDQKTIAISLSERDFHGRRLLIKDGGDFTGRPAAVKENAASADPDGAKPVGTPAAGSTGMSKTAQKILRIQKQPPGPTLFLGNLGFEATEKSIRELFEAHRGLKEKKDGDEEKAEEQDAKPKDKWIRKIRLGTFEDTGNCKGWAFIDFTNPENATAALVNPKNHRLDGRSLVVEYASPDAVRRGGFGPRPKLGDPAGEQGGSSRRPERVGPRGLKQRDRSGVDSQGQEQDQSADKGRGWKGSREAGAQVGVVVTEHAAAEVEAPRKKYEDSGPGGYKGVKGRSKPGAALALAKRESTAIVASEGKKITF